jgi:sugar lactone lactonase YvrE
MQLDHRLRRALEAPIVDVDTPSTERDLHVTLRLGRRRRWIRRVLAVGTVLAVVAGVVVLGPRAIDALRSIDEPRPATPEDPKGTPGVITTVVGNGESASLGDGGLAVDAAIRYPFDLVVDGDGNLYVLENRRVRKVDPSGRITTVVGPPAAAAGGDLTEANLLELSGNTNALAIDEEGNLYVGGGDGDHYTVNRISPSGAVTRVAGTGQPGFSGDGGPAIDAELGWVYDLAVDPSGALYIADNENHRIRMVDTNGVITTIAGTGEQGWSGDGGPAAEARLDRPTGLALDANGNLYFTVRPGIVRRIDAVSGVITTVAGSGKVGYNGDGGPATDARMNAPEHVAVAEDGTIYIEDTGNNCIRTVDTSGIITTVVGMRGRGFQGDGDPAATARLSEPSGMLLTPDGVLYIADSGNNRVRRVVLELR